MFAVLVSCSFCLQSYPKGNIIVLWSGSGSPVFLIIFLVFTMSGFVRCSSSRAGSVVARPLACGWVWASRPLPVGGLSAGFSPAPCCLFVPFVSRSLAVRFASAVALFGWRSWVRAGGSGSSVFASAGLPVPVFCVKVALPAGWSASSARPFLLGLLAPMGAV